MQDSDKYAAFMGLGPKRIPSWESWSCPDAETYITGIDYYEHPRSCRSRMRALYPWLELPVPEKDDPIPRPVLGLGGQSVATDENGRHCVRWGDGQSGHWDHGHRFRTPEDVFAFSPLQQGDFTELGMPEARDYRDEEKLYREFRAGRPAEWGDRALAGSTASTGFYNTMFMWPMLTFGWELFLETCLDPRFERIMDEFAEINRRVFRVFARLPVNFVMCHDDLFTTRGPVCSPEWMHKYIFPRYEEFWGIVKAAGKEVLFICDGRANAYADDLIACGVRGFRTEPYTDFKEIARRHKDCFLCGEGDNRVLMRNDAREIEAMVRDMLETAKMTGGYVMGIGNHIPWNVPPEAVKVYLDLCAELSCR